MNKLSGQTSPYLLQHADNPVHWHPWDEAALNLARQEDKPILLSIGYSACHWCHVMAHESFEDQGTADVMNRLFINIKVDREERPDLDKIYQSAHSMLTNRPGGWPLTLFLAPDDHMPIFAGTYFPDQPRHGLPSFVQLLEHVSDIYRTRKQDIAKQSHSIREAYSQMAQQDKISAATLSTMPLDVARNQIEQQFDSHDGGFSVAPKFPHPTIIDRALRHWAKTFAKQAKQGDTRILHAAVFTLEKMTSGGLFDHLGGGFCRYSTDEKWMIPHFEKMLYDNGPLLWLNAQAWCITHDRGHLDAATETADWVIREMQSPEGGYYSALDADSEGVEGKFYVWSPGQVAQVLDENIYPVFARRFGLDQAANFEDLWHLHGYASYTELASEFSLDENTLRQALREARERLLTVRQQRIHPGLDDKILTSWNGLMIQGMAAAARLLQRDDYLDSATRAAGFIRKNLWANHRLMATSKDGYSHLNAYLDDYAFLLSGLLELLRTRWNSEWLSWAEEIADVLIEQFEEADYGGFFFTSHDHEQLIQRSKVYADEATPSGNGIATSALLELGYLTGNTAYLNAAERCLKAAWQNISQAAISHCSLLNALECYLFPPQIIVIRARNKSLQQWRDYLGGRYMPGTQCYLIPDDANLPASLADKVAIGELNAYLCEGTRCLPPITDTETLQNFIDNNSFSLCQD